MSSMRRREFLKSASAAAASLAPIVAVQTTAEREASSRSAGGQELRIGTARYAERDYPIQRKDCAEVTLKDGFWKPKILTNATVTIPLLAARSDGRGLSGNVLQAAIQSLQTHPDRKLQALVDARLTALRSQPPRGNAASKSPRFISGPLAVETSSTTPSPRQTRCTQSSAQRTRRSRAASATPSTASRCTA